MGFLPTEPHFIHVPTETLIPGAALKYYGTVHAVEGSSQIAVTLDEEASVNFKKTFYCTAGPNPDELLINASVTNCTSLTVFMERYPLSGDGLELVNATLRRSQERAEVFTGALEGQMPSNAFHMLVPPREYQSQAASIFCRNRVLLLGDTVGLGKTVSAITALSDPYLYPAVYVTLTHLPRQVQESFRTFAPKIRTHIVTSSKRYDLTTVRGQSGFPLPDVTLISYSKLPSWGSYLASFAKTVIWDEVQELRRANSRRHEAATLLANAAIYRMGMSATPIYNYGGEIYQVLKAIDSNMLGSWEDFFEKWCSGTKAKPILINPKGFGQFLRESGLFLRRTREDVGRELPPCSYVLQPVSSNHKELEKVTESCTDLAKALLSASSSGFTKLQATQNLNMKLRLATGLDKAPFVAEFVRMLVESGEQVVLFGWHREVYDLWKEKFKDINYRMYTGSESIAHKEQAKQDFISGKSPLLILSLRSGVGLDGLQGCCSIGVFGEFDWSPGVQEQAIGRIWRDGQTKPVTAYYMISEEGSDLYMAETLDIKTLQSTGLCDPERKNADVDLFMNLEIDPNRIKELARRFLLANKDRLNRDDQTTLEMTLPAQTKKQGSFEFTAIALQDTSASDQARAQYFREE